MPPKAEKSPNQMTHANLLYLLLQGGRNANPVSVEGSGGLWIGADGCPLFEESGGYGKEFPHLFAVCRR
jgi:hypothetical protein